MREILLTVPDSFDGVQAQTYLRSVGFSGRALSKLKQSGGLTRNGLILRTVDVIRAGEEIRVLLDEQSDTPLANGSLSAARVYEDDDMVIYDKPPDMPVHPSIRHYDDTLANLFAAQYPGLPFRPINRLDRCTSGLCVCAKNRFSASSLAGTIQKVYYAVTEGTPPGDTISAPIGRADGSIIRRCVTPEGKPAVTRFEAVGGNSSHSLLRVTLETGRTHQIRVHMAYMGYPLCGDEMYGGNCSMIQRQALHCGEVTLLQPVTREQLHAEAPLPEDMKKLITEDRT